MKFVAAMLVLGACHSPNPADTLPDKYEIHTSLQQRFTIELNTSMGTGFSWQPIDSSYKQILRLDSVTVINNKVTEDGADTQVFHFTPIKKATIQLLFIRKRPWEKADKRDKEKNIHVYIE
ncbi:MAG: Chagasin family peptidase inhibitor [Bacteroidota bacterium]|jgi:predicted secreted protein